MAQQDGAANLKNRACMQKRQAQYLSGDERHGVALIPPLHCLPFDSDHSYSSRILVTGNFCYPH